MMVPMVRLEKLNKYFNKRKSNQLHVLNNIELDLPKTGLVMLLGPSGSGKTTLLNVIGGLDKFDHGSIEIAGKTFKRYQSRQWDDVRNYHIGYVFQNYHLIRSLSVYENVAYPLRLMGYKDEALIDEKVTYVLKAVNMYQFRKKNALALSGGQQQRVAIARAVVKNPDIIIADEPTGNLDSQNTVEVMTMLKNIAQDKLVLMVTHEKELAAFYGDRIINILDGQITSDDITHERGDFAFKYDETIYLQDLKKSELNTDHHQVSIFEDAQSDVPIHAMLVVKNNTIYIKMNHATKKVKLIDEHSTIQIKNETAKEAQKKIIQETTFDKASLELPIIEKKHSFMVSLKQAFFMALEKVIGTTRRGKIMLFSFLLAGMVMAYAASSIAAVVFVSPEPYMSHQKGYYQVTLENREGIDSNVTQLYEDTLAFLGDDGYINTLSRTTFNFVQPNGSVYPNASISANLDITELMRGDFVVGDLPTTNEEIVITSVIAETLIENATGQDVGIWSYDHLLSETLRVNGMDVTISGIVKSDINTIFVTREMSNILNQTSIYAPISVFNDEELTYGEIPSDEDALLVPETIAENFYGINLEEEVFPVTKTINSNTYVISGTHNMNDTQIYVTNATLEKIRFFEKYSNFYIYSSEQSTEQTLMDIYGSDFIVFDIYASASASVTSQQQTFFVSTYTTAGIVIGIASLGFYFVIRSSLTKRQYDIAIMRAIGVYKRDIFRAFAVEIILLTTVSTLLGYLVASYGFHLLSNSLLGDLNFFKVTTMSIIVGMIAAYVINLIAGLLPVWRLLRKTPAHIISEYDM